MATVASLRAQVAAMKVKATPERQARQWSIILEEGEELSEELRSQLGENDVISIRRFPKGYLTNGGECTHSQVMSSWGRGPGGRNRPHVVREYGCDTDKV